VVALGHLAHTFLAVVRAEEHTRGPAPVGLIALTCNEILFTTAVVRPMRDAALRLDYHRTLCGRDHE
jgi:predicted aconitase with swiveling domain